MTEPAPERDRPQPQGQPEKVHGDPVHGDPVHGEPAHRVESEPVHRVESEPIDPDQEDAEIAD